MIRLLSTVLQVFSIYTVHLDLCKIQFISCREFTIEPKICYFILCFKILNSIKREWRENNVSWYDFPVKNEEKYHIPGILQVWAFELLNCELFWISYFIFFKLLLWKGYWNISNINHIIQSGSGRYILDSRGRES